MLGTTRGQREDKPEASQQEKLGQLLEVSYHERKSLARCMGAEASVVWVRDTQAGVEGNHKVRDDKKLHALSESNSVKLTLRLSWCGKVW